MRHPFTTIALSAAPLVACTQPESGASLPTEPAAALALEAEAHGVLAALVRLLHDADPESVEVSHPAGFASSQVDFRTSRGAQNQISQEDDHLLWNGIAVSPGDRRARA